MSQEETWGENDPVVKTVSKDDSWGDNDPVAEKKNGGSDSPLPAKQPTSLLDMLGANQNTTEQSPTQNIIDAATGKKQLPEDQPLTQAQIDKGTANLAANPIQNTPVTQAEQQNPNLVEGQNQAIDVKKARDIAMQEYQKVQANPKTKDLQTTLIQKGRTLDAIHSDPKVKQISDLYQRLDEANNAGKQDEATLIKSQIDGLEAQPVTPTVSENPNEPSAYVNGQAQVTPTMIAQEKTKLADLPANATYGDLMKKLHEHSTDYNKAHAEYSQIVAPAEAAKKVAQQAAQFTPDENGVQTKEGFLQGAGLGIKNTIGNIASGLLRVTGQDQTADELRERNRMNDILFPQETKGYPAAIGEMLGSVAPYTAGAITAPESLWAQAAVGSSMMGLSAKGETYDNVYNEVLNQGGTVEEAKAKAAHDSNVSAVAQGTVGAIMPFNESLAPIFKAGEMGAVKKALVDAGLNLSEFGVSGAAEDALNHKDVWNGAGERLQQGAALMALMHLPHLGGAVKDIIDRSISRRLPDVEAQVNNMVANGQVTPEEAATFLKPYQEQAEVMSKMPSDLPASKEQQIYPLLQEKMALLEKKKNLDSSFHPAIDEKIKGNEETGKKGIDGEIQDILAGRGNEETKAERNERVASDIKTNGSPQDEDLIHYGENQKAIDDILGQINQEQNEVQEPSAGTESQGDTRVLGQDQPNPIQETDGQSKTIASTDNQVQPQDGVEKDVAPSIDLTPTDTKTVEVKNPAKDELIKRGFTEEDLKDLDQTQIQHLFDTNATPTEVVSSAKVNTVKEVEKQLNIERAHKLLDAETDEQKAAINKEYDAKIAELYPTPQDIKVADDHFNNQPDEEKDTIKQLHEQSPERVVGDNTPTSENKPDETAQVTPSDEERQTSEVGGKDSEVKPEDNAPEEEGRITGTKNETTDKELEELHLDPIEKKEVLKNKDAFESAKKKVDNGEIDPIKLAQEKNGEKNPFLTTEETFAMLYKRAQILKDYDVDLAEQSKAVAADDKLKATELAQKIAKHQSDYNDIAKALKAAGTEAGRSLQARRREINSDYSLLAIKARIKEANLDAPIPAETEKKIESLHADLTEANNKIAEHEKRIKELEKNRSTKNTGRSRARGKDLIAEGLHDLGSILGAVKNFDATTDQATLVTALSKIGQGLIDEGIATADNVWAKVKAHVKEHLGHDLPDEYKDDVTKDLKDNPKLKSYKTRIKNIIQKREAKIASGDFSKEQRNKLVLDREAIRLKGEAAKIKSKIDLEQAKIEEANLPKYDKALDWAARWKRFAVLTYTSTIGKLVSAGAEQSLVFTPARKIIQTGLGKLPVINRIAAKAPTEGHYSIKALAANYAEWFKKEAYKDALDKIRGGKDTLEALHGKEHHQAKHFTDFASNVHGAIKVLPKRSEYWSSVQSGAEHAIKNGEDLTDPEVQAKIHQMAYDNAIRNIFMNKNQATDYYRTVLHRLEDSGKFGKLLSAVIRVDLPVVSVPTNIVNDVASYTGGAVKAAWTIYDEGAKKVDNLTPEQADHVMRSLGKQTVGLIAMAAAIGVYKNIGGFYHRGDKKKPDDLKEGTIKAGETNIPSMFLHHPALISLQAAADMQKQIEAYKAKGDGHPNANGALKSLLAVASTIPFMEAISGVSDLKDAKNPVQLIEKMGAAQAKGNIPGFIQEIAKWTDKDSEGNPIPRDTKDPLNNIKTGIPGLRQTVPPPDVKMDKAERLGAIMKNEGKPQSQIDLTTKSIRTKAALESDRKKVGIKIRKLKDKGIKDPDFAKTEDYNSQLKDLYDKKSKIK